LLLLLIAKQSSPFSTAASFWHVFIAFEVDDLVLLDKLYDADTLEIAGWPPLVPIEYGIGFEIG